jgi:nucleoside-diphosphate-sugar epimerase
MKVLVTGHDGYIGAVMTPLLAVVGHAVVGLDTGLRRRAR